ncbi:hypothetical protein F4823DRAFT_628692 [Ustulina deusta]|nr:hypothetical protein F4823DRAFT_628692 [Ustulina deusta]
MSEQQSAATQASPENAAQRVFDPVKDNPEKAEKFVRAIFKQKPDNISLVSAELAPLCGFGPNSNRDVLARSRVQAVFVSPETREPLKEFLAYFTRSHWDLPLAKFSPTLALVHEHRADWIRPEYPVPRDGSPEEFYARFLIRILHRIESPGGVGTYMLEWLRDAKDDREDKLKTMDMNKSRAPLGDRALHYISKLTHSNS